MRKVEFSVINYPQFCELILYKKRILIYILLVENQISTDEDETIRKYPTFRIFTENYPIKSLYSLYSKAFKVFLSNRISLALSHIFHIKKLLYNNLPKMLLSHIMIREYWRFLVDY